MLRDELWPDTVVSYEHGTEYRLNKLPLLGAPRRVPCFVETLPRLGYRFIDPVVKPGEGRSERR